MIAMPPRYPHSILACLIGLQLMAGCRQNEVPERPASLPGAPRPGPDPGIFLETLPTTLPGMMPVRTSASQTANDGRFYTAAEAVFQDRRGRTLFLRLSERNLLKGWSADTVNLAGKADVEVADDEGYTRSGSFQGHPSVERYRKRMQASQLNVMLGPMLVVECRGLNMEVETLKQILAGWDLGPADQLQEKLVLARAPESRARP